MAKSVEFVYIYRPYKKTESITAVTTLGKSMNPRKLLYLFTEDRVVDSETLQPI